MTSACTHTPKTGRETSYEWIDFKCTECWQIYDALKHMEWLKSLARRMETYELNKYGYITIYGKEKKPSGRPDGLWILGAVTAEELPKLLKMKEMP